MEMIMELPEDLRIEIVSTIPKQARPEPVVGRRSSGEQPNQAEGAAEGEEGKQEGNDNPLL